MGPEKNTNVIIGSGEGGKYLAWHLAQSGEKTVVVERRWIGGSCPNVNCLPSKNEIWSAKVANLFHHGSHFGATAIEGPSDMALVRKRKREMVEGLIEMHLERYKASGAELVMGEAKFIDAQVIEVKLNDGGTRTLTSERVFLNLGTHASIPAVHGSRNPWLSPILNCSN
jgi:pyruvate/2-oxoglutarate dehydrogenase complex dihydrolipoamide dehydrogenase (E3) component